MFYLQNFLMYAAILSAIFGVGMSYWIIATRPRRLAPAYRRVGPDARGEYPGPLLDDGHALERLERFSVDGRRRDLR